MAIDPNYPNTGTYFDGAQTGGGAGGGPKGGTPWAGRTNSGLSTQIIIKVCGAPVGALQKLSVSQTRPLERVKEIGTDGVIEIVPNGATIFELSATRIVFDQVRLPEAFLRAFRFINSQRAPFDIDVMDLSGGGIVTMTYKNCWFTTYSTPYQSDTYLITEDATLWCETAFLVDPTGAGGVPGGSPRGYDGLSQTDNDGIEKTVNMGDQGRRGSMDVAGLLGSVFNK